MAKASINRVKWVYFPALGGRAAPLRDHQAAELHKFRARNARTDVGQADFGSPVGPARRRSRARRAASGPEAKIAVVF
jgi:hypothetical protein